MNVSPIGVSRIVPKNEALFGIYRRITELGCSEVRERVLKDGSRVLLGYNEGSRLANVAQKYTPQGWMQRQNFFSNDVYGKFGNLREVHNEKVWYNKIGDVLKSTFKIRNYDKGELVKKQNVFTDIIEGVDKSVTEFTDKATLKDPNSVAKITKERIDPFHFVETHFNKDGKVFIKEKVVISDLAMWKY